MRTSQTPAGTRAASRRSARVGFSRDAAARYANFRRSAATEAACWPPVARRPTSAVRSVACVCCVCPQLAPGVPSAWLEAGVFASARRAEATVIVVSRMGPPRRSASSCPCSARPFPTNDSRSISLVRVLYHSSTPPYYGAIDRPTIYLSTELASARVFTGSVPRLKHPLPSASKCVRGSVCAGQSESGSLGVSTSGSGYLMSLLQQNMSCACGLEFLGWGHSILGLGACVWPRVLGVGAFQTRSRFAVVSGRTQGGGAAGGVCTGHLHSISIEFSGSGRSRRDLGLP